MASKTTKKPKAVKPITATTLPTAAAVATAISGAKGSNLLPANVQVAQPPNGQTATYGNVLTVGRKQYGGQYYGTLTAANYQLATTFTTAVLAAVKGSIAQVTPVKLSYNVANVHGTMQRIGVLSYHAQQAQVHIRYLSAQGHIHAKALGLTVYGPNMAAPIGQQGPKAHSNHVVLTSANMATVVTLFAAHANNVIVATSN